ncbi:B-box zinc finger protein 32 [Pistacia vera]|uniref:B-box zinc finger protein 32 n=1 Tax=Pistacia vera TaxID=55513 RepID=UPI0012634766|nr:B-box zinc finger protein 32 [Pistacia vera]
MKELKPAKSCELCHQEASLYCDSDSAFLCFTCDARVHEANFLVARHVRQTLCCKCNCLTGNFISGARSLSSLSPICQSCFQENPLHSTTITNTTSSSSSDCISSTEDSAKKIGSNHNIKRRNKISSSSSTVSEVSGEISDFPARLCGEKREKDASKAEGIFVIWCKWLGLSGNCDVVSLACQVFELCLERLTVLPKRVSLAASFWVALRMYGGDRSMGSRQNLRRLEEVSGVPAKLIVAVERKLARVMRVKRRARYDLEEGWAECNA